MTDSERIALVRSALEKIGPLRDTLLNSPIYLFPDPVPFGSKQDYKAAVDNLGKIETALKQQRIAFEKLPPSIAEAMPFGLEGLNDAIDKVSRLLQRAETERAEKWGKGRGRGKNLRARLIADEIARHYGRSKFEKPTVGHNDGEPSTDFTKAVAAVFGFVGVTADFRGPCSEAADKITPEFIEAARRVPPYLAAVALRASGAVAVEPTLLGNAGRTEIPAER